MINAGIKFQIPSNHCALLMNKSSARTKFYVQVQIGLIDVNYHDYIIIVIQNMTNQPLMLPKGIAVAQLLIIPNLIPKFEMKWPATTSTRGGFGSTGHNFELAATAL
jgi:dUTPase